MSPVRVLIAVAVAAALCIAAFFALRPPSKSSDALAPVLQFDAARVLSIRVQRPDGTSEALRRGANPGDWVIAIDSAGRTSEWPANPSNARAAVQVLSRVRPIRAAEAGAVLPDRTTMVTATIEGGGSSAMRLDSTVLAGGALAQALSPEKGPVVWVDATLADMLVKAGPREWRSIAVFHNITDAARITLQSGAAKIAVARVEGRWYVREPVSDAAEPETITRLADAIARVHVVDFLDSGPPAVGAGLDTPLVTISVETDTRDPQSGKSSTATSVLKVGQAADLAGKGYFASLSRPDGAERTLVVSSEEMAGLPRDPAMYVSRRLLTTPASDVASLTIGERRFARTLEGWRSVRDGKPMPLDAGDAETIASLLKVVTEAPATVAITDPPAAGSVSVSVTLGGLAGQPLAAVTAELLSDSAGKPTALVFRSGRIARGYASPDAIQLWPWISGH